MGLSVQEICGVEQQGAVSKSVRFTANQAKLGSLT